MAVIDCHFYSKYLAHQTEICVILPEIYGKPPKAEYPLLYLLHGRGDDCTSWLRNSNIERYADERNVAVVMPSAETSFYMDGVCGKRFFTFLTKELPCVVRLWFPVSKKAEKTYLAGLSMGGYGALKIGLTYPEAFAGIGIFSAGIRPDKMPDFALTPEENEILHENIRQAFGAGDFKPENIPQELILARIREGKKIPPVCHYEGRQDMLYDMNREFRDFAEAQPIHYRYEEWDGGHDWIFWDEALRRLLEQFFRA